MYCLDAEFALACFLYDGLSEEEATALYDHLRGCIWCRQLLGDMLLLKAMERVAGRRWRPRGVETGQLGGIVS
jgi:hypothetical protein